MQKLEDNASEGHRGRGPNIPGSPGDVRNRAWDERWENYTSLKLTANAPENGMVGRRITFVLGRGYVSFRECINPSGCRNFKKIVGHWDDNSTPNQCRREKTEGMILPSLGNCPMSLPKRHVRVDEMRYVTLPKTNISPEDRPKPKRKCLSSNHPFSGAFAVSFREGTCHHPGAPMICNGMEGSHPWLWWFPSASHMFSLLPRKLTAETQKMEVCLGRWFSFSNRWCLQVPAVSFRG